MPSVNGTQSRGDEGQQSSENRQQTKKNDRVITVQFLLYVLLIAAAVLGWHEFQTLFESGTEIMTWKNFLGVAVLFILWQLIAFTGPMSVGKFRCMVLFMYFVTLFSMLVPPIISIVLYQQDQKFLDAMARAPIGVLKGKIVDLEQDKEATNKLKPQWLVNIGGVVEPDIEPDIPSGDTAMQGKRKAQDDESHTSPAITQKEETYLVMGGVVVPFYMLVLAMMGAGINLTRQVPKIQNNMTKWTENSIQFKNNDKEPFVTWFPILGSWFVSFKPYNHERVDEVIADTRLNFISCYMYLLSAPFLAIAVFYLLRMIDDRGMPTPVLVVTSLATGLMSDKIVDAITNSAGRFIGEKETDKKEPPPKTVQVPIVSILSPVRTNKTYTSEQPQISLEGIALDAKKVTQVTWKNETTEKDGHASIEVPDLLSEKHVYKWKTKEILLQPGANSIMVEAEDETGNKSEAAQITIILEQEKNKSFEVHPNQRATLLATINS